ncbi:hypothetical protein BCR39DRAFT_538039 [Naematelia encephala]|uniref:Nucleosome assembly protein n=1 Tax=Naematelia encephala TaxID=71784 RepID=A0A1Y2AYR5_9TREE|nr:hypothetical protein BCR39DRAFT_538039 [Naematelia encephala]
MSAADEWKPAAPELSDDLIAELEKPGNEKKWRTMQFDARETKNYLETIRPKVKPIDSFWLIALTSHRVISPLISSKSDQHALSFVEHVELVQDEEDPRPYEIIFHFKENPYFTNSTLSKKFSLKDEFKDKKDGFEDDHLEPGIQKIDWKEGQNLTEKYPRQSGEDGDFEGDIGSFFHFFTEAEDIYGIGQLLQDEILPEAVGFFTGKEGQDEMNSEDEDEESGDEEDEIDLEDEEDDQPKKKRKY